MRETADPEQVELTLLLNIGAKGEPTNNGVEPIRTDIDPKNDENDPIKDIISGDLLSIYGLMKSQPTLTKPKRWTCGHIVFVRVILSHYSRLEVRTCRDDLDRRKLFALC